MRTIHVHFHDGINPLHHRPSSGGKKRLAKGGPVHGPFDQQDGQRTFGSWMEAQQFLTYLRNRGKQGQLVNSTVGGFNVVWKDQSSIMTYMMHNWPRSEEGHPAVQVYKQYHPHDTEDQEPAVSYHIMTENIGRNYRSILNPLFKSYNITNTQGVWKGGGEPSMQIEIWGKDTPELASKVRTAAQKIRTAGKQEEVLVSKESGQRYIF